MNPSYIQNKLHNQTQATNSQKFTDKRRVRYRLYFEKDIGFDWLEAQVGKVSEKTGVDLELYELISVGSPYSCVAIREVDKRKAKDDAQNSLRDFE